MLALLCREALVPADAEASPEAEAEVCKEAEAAPEELLLPEALGVLDRVLLEVTVAVAEPEELGQGVELKLGLTDLLAEALTDWEGESEGDLEELGEAEELLLGPMERLSVRVMDWLPLTLLQGLEVLEALTDTEREG